MTISIMYLFSFIPHLSLSWIDPYFFLRLSSQQWLTSSNIHLPSRAQFGKKLPVHVGLPIVSCHLNLVGYDLFLVLDFSISKLVIIIVIK